MNVKTKHGYRFGSVAIGMLVVGCGTDAASSDQGPGTSGAPAASGAMAGAASGGPDGAAATGAVSGNAGATGASTTGTAATGAPGTTPTDASLRDGPTAADSSLEDGNTGDAARGPVDAAVPRRDAAIGDGDAQAGIIAATPPVGWNSWNTFGCNISESLIEATADAIVSSGMQGAGFEYVNIDDCWMDGRDSSGNLRWNATKFPSGIPALATYVHGKGLKLGIYETPNTVTCVGLYGGISPSVAVGSLGHEQQDARTFASWGVDYLKYDLCQGQPSSFGVMRDALRATGRPIVYSINPGNGSGCPPTGATTSTCGLDLPATANLWRIAFDINASWSSITGLIDADAPLSAYAGPGHWNDPDMLEVGNGTLSTAENQSHFSMWALLAAPLLAGNDIRSMSSAVKAILTNGEVVAIDQDARGAQGTLVATPASGLQIWSKPLTATNQRAVALLNRSANTASITVSFSQIGLTSGSAGVRDLWQHADLGMFDGSYTAANIPSHGVAMLLITQ